MSAGAFTSGIYVTDAGTPVNITVQPETKSLTLNAVANADGTGPIQAGLPSAKVSGSQRSIGINARKVRVRFTGAVPTGYLGTTGILTLPVLTKTTWDSYAKQQTGTYTLEGTAYDIEFVGKTPESIN